MDDFREQERPDRLIDDLPAVVERSLLDSDAPPLPGWEPVLSVTDRVIGALENVDPEDCPLVLVGHGLAWTLLAAHLVGTSPDPAKWHRLLMPDHCSINAVTGA